MSCNAVCMSRPAVANKAFTGATVAAKPTRVVARVATRVQCSANKKTEALVAGVTASVATMMANPLVAEAAVSPSLKNLLTSVIAGAVVLAGIAGAVTAVSSFDQISRK